MQPYISIFTTTWKTKKIKETTWPELEKKLFTKKTSEHKRKSIYNACWLGTSVALMNNIFFNSSNQNSVYNQSAWLKSLSYKIPKMHTYNNKKNIFKGQINGKATVGRMQLS